MVDRLPYVPRLDLWYLANSTSGTLPKQHAGRAQNEIARAEGWAVYHRFADDQLDPADAAACTCIAASACSRTPRHALRLRAAARRRGQGPPRRGRASASSTTRRSGMVSTTMLYDDRSQRLGITIPMIVEHLIKTPDDYAPAGYLFEHMDVVPNFERFRALGRPRTCATTAWPWRMGSHRRLAGPPDPARPARSDAVLLPLQGPPREMRRLAERIEPLFDKALAILCRLARRGGLVGRELRRHAHVPALLRAGDPALDPQGVATRWAPAGKLVLCHTDGENEGLMDLIRDSGMHIAESICPAPMTKVTLAEYYRRWSGHLTLFGGIPSTIVLPDTSDADFEAYMDELFRRSRRASACVVGIADQVPPDGGLLAAAAHRRAHREGRPAAAAGRRVPPGRRRGARAPARRRGRGRSGAGRRRVRRRSGRTSSRASTSTSRRTSRRCSTAACRRGDILDRGLIAAINVVGKRMAAGAGVHPGGAAGRARDERGRRRARAAPRRQRRAAARARC